MEFNFSRICVDNGPIAIAVGEPFYKRSPNKVKLAVLGFRGKVISV